MDKKKKKIDELQRLFNTCVKFENLQSDEILKMSKELDTLIVESINSKFATCLLKD